MYSVLIACTYPINRGDELLLSSLEAALTRSLGRVAFKRTVLNAASSGGVESVKQPLGLLMKVSVVFGLGLGSRLARLIVPVLLKWIDFSPRLAPWFVDLVEPSTWNAIRKSARTADVCVSSAGGYLLAETEDEWLWLSHLVTLRLIKSSDCAVVSAPCSIGPFNSVWESLAARIPSAFDYIYVRDQTSYDFVERLLSVSSCSPILKRTVDLGFAHPWRPTAALTVEGRARPVVGVSVRFYRFGGSDNEAEMRERFEESVAGALRRLIAENGCQIVFFSQDHGGIYSDAEYAKRINVRLGGAAEIIEDRIPIERMLVRYGELDALIGVRMHACIMALSMGTPVVPIAYEPKTYGAMADFDAEQDVFDIRTVDEADMYAGAVAILNGGNILRNDRFVHASRAAEAAVSFCSSVLQVVHAASKGDS